MSLFNIGLILLHIAFNSSRYIGLLHSFTLYNIFNFSLKIFFELYVLKIYFYIIKNKIITYYTDNFVFFINF